MSDERAPARCPVCGAGLGTADLRTCTACATPHHRECWDYAGGCAIFGCRTRPWRMPAAASERAALGDDFQRWLNAGRNQWLAAGAGQVGFLGVLLGLTLMLGAANLTPGSAALPLVAALLTALGGAGALGGMAAWLLLRSRTMGAAYALEERLEEPLPCGASVPRAVLDRFAAQIEPSALERGLTTGFTACAALMAAVVVGLVANDVATPGSLAFRDVRMLFTAAPLLGISGALAAAAFRRSAVERRRELALLERRLEASLENAKGSPPEA